MKVNVCLIRFCLTAFVGLFAAQTYADCYSGACGGSSVSSVQSSTSITGDHTGYGTNYLTGSVNACGGSYASCNGLSNPNFSPSTIGGCYSANGYYGYSSHGCSGRAGTYGCNASGYDGYGASRSNVESSAWGVSECGRLPSSLGSPMYGAGGSLPSGGIQTYESGSSQCGSCGVQSSSVISSGDWSSLSPRGIPNVSGQVQAEKPLTDIRVWTHRDGRKVKGLLVAVRSSDIRLIVSGRTFTVSRTELSADDRYLLRGIQTHDQGSEQYNFLHLPGDSISRTWTDDRGRQFVGDLVALWGNSLMIQKKDRVYIVSPKRLSATDRLVLQQALGSETKLANLVR